MGYDPDRGALVESGCIPDICCHPGWGDELHIMRSEQIAEGFCMRTPAPAPRTSCAYIGFNRGPSAEHTPVPEEVELWADCVVIMNKEADFRGIEDADEMIDLIERDPFQMMQVTGNGPEIIISYQEIKDETKLGEGVGANQISVDGDPDHVIIVRGDEGDECGEHMEI